jgi:hypothetical protein
MHMVAPATATVRPRPAQTKLHDAARLETRPVAEARDRTEKSAFHIALPQSEPPADALPLAPVPSAKNSLRPVEVYGYSFWRNGQSARSQLGLGQYGGSQSAVLIALPIQRFSRTEGPTRFALIGRVSASHGDVREREFAAGLRWRPLASTPVQLSVERRVREDRPDATAAFVSGGTDGINLPLGFVFDGYGQAGFVGGKGGGGFADVQLKAQRQILREARAVINAGVGLWGGGQDELLRVEIGPSIQAILPASRAQFRLDVSWRFQIAGNVQPDNGPAVTLSTSF